MPSKFDHVIICREAARGKIAASRARQVPSGMPSTALRPSPEHPVPLVPTYPISHSWHVMIKIPAVDELLSTGRPEGD
jgi:hypothetical protein